MVGRKDGRVGQKAGLIKALKLALSYTVSRFAYILVYVRDQQVVRFLANWILLSQRDGSFRALLPGSEGASVI